MVVAPLIEVAKMDAPSAYVHVPFCRHRCGYCNFTLIAGRDDLIDRYLDALSAELQQLQQPRSVQTVFLGGGTPSHLPRPQLERFLATVFNWFRPVADAEISCEVNPQDVTAELVTTLATAGVNRISMGVQSFDDAKLTFLERDHDAAQVRIATDLVRSKIASLSYDLIFATPRDEQVWESDLESAISLGPDHISTYGLTIESGTRFFGMRERECFREVDETQQRLQFETAIDRLTAAGYGQYEVSSFCQPGHRCRHNLNYWQGGNYFAVGPGAARHFDGTRETNHRSTTTYLRLIQQLGYAIGDAERLPRLDRAKERVVFGLRMIEQGINVDQIAQQFDFTPEQIGLQRLQNYVANGWLEPTASGNLRLTREGLMISDGLLAELL